MKISTPILRRLGPIPFWRGTSKCMAELESVYRRAREAAEFKLRGERSKEDASTFDIIHPTRRKV
jgi:hypothetical protein